MGEAVLEQPSIAQRRTHVRQIVLRESRSVQMGNFLRVGPADLRLLFRLYDAQFFQGEIGTLLVQSGAGPCGFSLSGRLRSSGGITRRRVDRRTGKCAYEIVLSSALLMDNFKDGRGCTLVGVHCVDRLDGMMRVFEHELLHLLEFLRYSRSNCAARRFQVLSRIYFGHTEHRHKMVTARQRTLASTTLRPGAAVRFVHEGRPLEGIVNTIHKRATVLVENRDGRRYTNGRRYLKFYVPLALLRPA